ncbi:hypothetical protein [Xenorhabdus bharatensis]|uniref:hypothetical protein n=1 Tax=Xenorhabdus bharatensis TaxID=3136256 RepID=UPI0030F3995D
MINIKDNLLIPPSYPQAVDGKIDIQGQKHETTKYIMILVTHYSNENISDQILGHLKDTYNENVIIKSIPKIINEKPDNFIPIFFPIDDFSKNTTYSGYYMVTKLLSGNTNLSDSSKVTVVNAEKTVPPKPVELDQINIILSDTVKLSDGNLELKRATYTSYYTIEKPTFGDKVDFYNPSIGITTSSKKNEYIYSRIVLRGRKGSDI